MCCFSVVSDSVSILLPRAIASPPLVRGGGRTVACRMPAPLLITIRGKYASGLTTARAADGKAWLGSAARGTIQRGGDENSPIVLEVLVSPSVLPLSFVLTSPFVKCFRCVGWRFVGTREVSRFQRSVFNLLLDSQLLVSTSMQQYIIYSLHSCQILSPSETGFIVSAHRLTNITLLTLIATL